MTKYLADPGKAVNCSTNTNAIQLLSESFTILLNIFENALMPKLQELVVNC